VSVHYDRGRRTWFFAVRAVADSGTVRQVRRRGFATKGLAKRAERDFLHEVDSGGFVMSDRSTVGEYLIEVWLPALEANVRNRKPTTIDTYRRLTRAHLIVHLGRHELRKLTAAHVETMLGAVAVSAKSRRNIVGVLSTALEDARRWGYVTKNVAHGVELPRLDPLPPKAWAMVELARFMAAAQSERLAPVWQFAAMTGVRRGEALGLRWREVDLDAGVATITHTRTIAGGSVVEGTTKSAAGARTIALDADLVAMLRALKLAQATELLGLGLRPGADGYVFTNEEGGPYWPQRVTARFRELTDELGLPRIGVHGLRHTSVTWAIASGQNPKAVAARHGHASSSFTIARYSHVMPGHDRAAAEAFASALREAVCCHDVATEADSAR
jgi:integrase